MKEKPIIFSGYKVRRILEWDFERDGDMQTRCVIKKFPPAGLMLESEAGGWCPYGKVGSRLWVKETYQTIYERPDGQRFCQAPPRPPERRQKFWIEYAATIKDEEPPRWKSPIFMPRKYSRLTLEITDIRVERLQDISEDDAKAEGVIPSVAVGAEVIGGRFESYRVSFWQKWDSLNTKRSYSWESNPWVWKITFCLASGQAGEEKEL